MKSEKFLNFLWIAGGFLALAWLTELEALLHARHHGISLNQGLRMLFGQLENLCISAVLASPWLICRPGSKIGKPALLILTALTSIYIVIEQVFYRLSAVHFSLSHFESSNSRDLLRLWDSFRNELDVTVWINLALVTAWLGIFAYRRHLSILRFRTPSVRGFSIPILFLIGSGAFEYFYPDNRETKHPIIALLSPGEESEVLIENPDLDLYSLRYGSPLPPDLEEADRFTSDRPNIVFMILESVGSMNMLKNGKIDTATFPRLSKFQDSTLVFDNVTNIFPGTTRSHIPIHTGGRVFTWGSVNDELKYRYGADTLPSVLSRSGYRTGLFSAMYLDFENLDSFYKNLGFDHYFAPDESEIPEASKIHSWGLDEAYLLPHVFRWIDSNDESPLFLNFLTNTTHHPYGAGKGYQSPFPSDGRLSDYHTALHYTDSVIGELIDGLKARRLNNNTYLVICGDHGQAFSMKHEGNMLHKNFLYEENIRNFLLLVDLSGEANGRLLKRRAWIGDIMPTILGLSGLSPDSIRGEDLQDIQYKESIAYFHKNATPERWGLRDGNFKFIARRIGDHQPEIYNLDSDPDEAVNLAKKHPERTKAYTELVKNWFMRSNREFAERLEGYEFDKKTSLSMEDLSVPGPKRIAVGLIDEDGKFHNRSKVHPEEDIEIFTYGVSFEEDKLLHYDFIDPEGEKKTISFTHEEGWTLTNLTFTRESPMKEGTWRVVIRDARRAFGEVNYLVSKEAPLTRSFFDSESRGPTELRFGLRDESGKFEEAMVFHPMAGNMQAFSFGKPFGKATDLNYRWTSPSGVSKSFLFKWQAGWDKTWVFHDADLPMEEGVWSLSIFKKGRRQPLVTNTFEVSSEASPKKAQQ